MRHTCSTRVLAQVHRDHYMLNAETITAVPETVAWADFITLWRDLVTSSDGDKARDRGRGRCDPQRNQLKLC